MSKFLLSFLCSATLLSAGVVVPDDYKISDEEELSYVYSSEYDAVMPDMKAYQEAMLETYEKEYGFKLDDTLYVGMASQNNQIANGFSTQFPFNSQIFYGAGASYIDYFCFSSWLKTLVIHETAHNFQLNPKENTLSRVSHKVLGNNPVSFLAFLPLFPVPNMTESSFILEGNAVMNESRYGNGGRLFSGYALAEVVSLAKAGEITPAMMYNQTFEFPYNEKFYLVGGFFQQFLLKRYGIEKVNHYFKTYATQPVPFFTNWMFEEQFGKSFEVLLAEFVEEVQREHQNFVQSKGETIAQSQAFVPLNVKGNTVFTLISDRKSIPQVLEVNRQSQKVQFIDGSWSIGEVFKTNGQYYTQASLKTSPVKIEMGLFDKDAYLLKGTAGKAVQGYTSKGEMVYFDVATSLETPQVYVGDTFYTQSHSSVYVHGEDVYYFKQEGEKRTLYKNRTALFSYQGHYGFVTEIDNEGGIYFIALSKHGSTVYRFFKGQSSRVVQGDDVIEFKLLNNNKALIATIGAKGYRYKIIALGRLGFSQQPFEPSIAQDGRLKQTLRVSKFGQKKKVLSSKAYTPLTQLQYSSLNQALSYGSYSGAGIDLQANFSDPLQQNNLSALVSYNENRTIFGGRYNNSAHQLQFGGAVFAVKDDSFIRTRRDMGYDAYLRLPLIETGYWKVQTGLNYTEPYNTLYRKPLTFSLEVENAKRYGFSKYPNNYAQVELFATKERESKILGARYDFINDIPFVTKQIYWGLKGAHLKSNEVNAFQEKGIELTDTFASIQSDRATLNFPSFFGKTYVKEVKMAEMSLHKVFDGSLYFYSLPLSLQRETVYLKQRFYDVDFNRNFNKQYNESTLGFEADLLLFHKLSVPLSLEWLYNPDVLDKKQFRVLIGGSF